MASPYSQPRQEIIDLLLRDNNDKVRKSEKLPIIWDSSGSGGSHSDNTSRQGGTAEGERGPGGEGGDAMDREFLTLQNVELELKKSQNTIDVETVKNAVGTGQWRLFGEDGRQKVVDYLCKLLRKEDIPMPIMTLMESLNIMSVTGWRSVFGWLPFVTSNSQLREKVMEALVSAKTTHDEKVEKVRNNLLCELINHIRNLHTERKFSRDNIVHLQSTVDVMKKNKENADIVAGTMAVQLQQLSDTLTSSTKINEDLREALNQTAGDLKLANETARTANHKLAETLRKLQSLEDAEKTMAAKRESDMEDLRQSIVKMQKAMSDLLGASITQATELAHLKSTLQLKDHRIQELETELKRRIDQNDQLMEREKKVAEQAAILAAKEKQVNESKTAIDALTSSLDSQPMTAKSFSDCPSGAACSSGAAASTVAAAAAASVSGDDFVHIDA